MEFTQCGQAGGSGGRTSRSSEGKGVGMGFIGGSPESFCQFFEGHFALHARDDFLV